jgi:hypothetical protein
MMIDADSIISAFCFLHPRAGGARLARTVENGCAEEMQLVVRNHRAVTGPWLSSITGTGRKQFANAFKFWVDKGYKYS